MRDQYRAIVEQLERSFHQAAELLDQANEELLAVTHFPKHLWRQI